MVISERIALRSVVEQGWTQLKEQVLGQLKKTIEGLVEAARDRRLAERRQQGEKVYRWGYRVRKGWQTLWGELRQVRVRRLRGREEIGLVEKYQRHGWDWKRWNGSSATAWRASPQRLRSLIPLRPTSSASLIGSAACSNGSRRWSAVEGGSSGGSGRPPKSGNGASGRPAFAGVDVSGHR